MSFKSKGPKSHPSHSPKAKPEPPKPTPEKDSKPSNQKPNQKPKHKPNQNSKPQPGKIRQDKNQKPKTNPSEKSKNNISPPLLDLNNNAKKIITNLASQPIKEHTTPPTKSPLEPNKESKNRIIRPVFKPNMIQNGNNRIKRPNFKPDQHKGSKNIISRLIFDPNKPSSNKNKISRPNFIPNDEAKNKIIKYTIESTGKPKNRINRYQIDSGKNQQYNNKIRRIPFKPNDEIKNNTESTPARPKHIKNNSQPAIIKPTTTPPQITKNKIIKTEPLTHPQKETRKNIVKSRWAFLNYDAQGNLLSREVKMQNAVNHFNREILPELMKDPAIAKKIKKLHTVGSNDLVRKNYSGFLNALSREHKIKWSELKSTISPIKITTHLTMLKGKTSLKPKPKTKSKPDLNYDYFSMNYDDNLNPLNREQKLQKAITVYNQKILPDLQNVPEIKEKLENGKSVSYRDLENQGYGNFYEALNRNGVKIRWNEFKQEAGYKVNIDHEKYKFLNYDQNGNRINPEEKLVIALDHYNNIILPDLMKIPEIKQKIESGYPPALDDLIKYGHPGFIAPLSQKEPKIHYNTLIEAAGLKPNVDHNKYRFLNYNEQDTPHSYQDKMEIAKEFFSNIIVPKLIEKDLIRPGETPGLREMVKGGFSGFFPSLAFKEQKIDYNDLIQAVGLDPNITHGRWDFIKYDHNGNILSKEEKLANAADYFNTIVYPDLINKDAVKQGEAPTSLDLQDYKHEDFLSALRGKEPKVSFNRLIEHAGFTPHDFNTLSTIGTNFHWTAEKIFLEHTRNQNCTSFYEVRGNGDNSIVVDKNFKNLSNGADLLAQLRPNIKIINFDYFLSNSEKSKTDHSQRNYQGEEVALCLIPLNANEPQDIDQDIPHSNNVLVLNPKGFAAFLGYKDGIYDKFMESVQLARIAMYDEEAKEILYEMRVEAYDALKSNENDLNYSTKEFKKFRDTQKET